MSARDDTELESNGKFCIALELSAECCPECGEPREPGECPECGVEVGVSEETTKAARARRAALTDARRQLTKALERFEALKPGNVPVSNDQFATAVSDAGLFDQLRRMTEIGHQLAQLDLNDPAVIGNTLRTRSLERAADVEQLAKTCEDLAVFDPHGPAAELRTVAAESGRYGAQLTHVFFDILVAETIPDARSAEAEMQAMLAGFPYSERISQLLDEMDGWIVRDFDARAALVLEREGNYCDEHGFLDLFAVFSAYEAAENPMEEMARCGRRYFSHLIDEETPPGPVDSFLVLPAIGLATLDRPLTGHRVAAALYRLLAEAEKKAPEPTAAVINQTASEGGLVLAAMERIRRSLVYLAAAEETGVADETGELQVAMESYKELAETSLRTYGGLVLVLEAIKRGKKVEPGSPPMLGQLMQRLEASAEPAAALLADASETKLRNACSHSQYRWEESSAEIVDLRTGARWSREEFELASEALGGALAGADAGYACFALQGPVDLDAPAWVSGSGRLAEVVAKVYFETRGFRVHEVSDSGLSVVISDETELEKLGLMATLGGLISIAGEDDVLKVSGRSRGLLLEVDVASFAEAQAAPEGVKDLAILLPFHSNALRAEARPPDKALLEWAAVMTNQVITTVDPDCGAGGQMQAGDRLGFICDFLGSAEGSRNEGPAALRKRVARCRGLAFSAARGETDAWPRFAQELLELNRWVAQLGIVWPPQF